MGMRKVLLIVGLLLASGCRQASDAANALLSPPDAYSHLSDRLIARMMFWGIPWGLPCLRTANRSDVALHVPDDQCYKLMPPKRYQGLWRDDPEGARFCPAPAASCTQQSSGERIRFEPREYGVVELPIRGGRALYRVDFIGRHTAKQGNYSHMQVAHFDQEVVVDRLLSLAELQPPVKS